MLKWANISLLWIEYLNILLQNHWANFNQTWHKASLWMMEIQVCLKEGPHAFPRGVNYKIAKIHWEIWKYSSPEPLGQFKIYFARSILGWREFKFVQIKWPTLFQGEIISKKWNYIDKFKNLLLRNHWANFNQRHNSFLGEGDSSLFKWRTIQFSKICLNQRYDIIICVYWLSCFLMEPLYILKMRNRKI